MRAAREEPEQVLGVAAIQPVERAGVAGREERRVGGGGRGHASGSSEQARSL